MQRFWEFTQFRYEKPTSFPKTLLPHIVEGGVLSLIPEDDQDGLQQFRGGRMHEQPLFLPYWKNW